MAQQFFLSNLPLGLRYGLLVILVTRRFNSIYHKILMILLIEGLGQELVLTRADILRKFKYYTCSLAHINYQWKKIYH